MPLENTERQQLAYEGVKVQAELDYVIWLLHSATSVTVALQANIALQRMRDWVDHIVAEGSD
jgi:hypothetical protein